MTITTLALLSLLAAPSRAQIAVDAAQMEAVSAAKTSLQQRLAPAQAGAEGIAKLMERLIREGDAEPNEEGRILSFSGKAVGDESELPLNLAIRLYEVPVREAPAEDGAVAIRDLVYRRAFSHMEGLSQKVRELKDGAAEVDEWKYTLGLDGAILKAEHSLVVITALDPSTGRAVVDQTRSRFYTMSPRDPAVLKRWKRLEKAFLLLGRVSET